MNLAVLLCLLVMVVPATPFFSTKLINWGKSFFVKPKTEVCYDDLDCFRKEGDFKHHVLPWSPDEIKVKVKLNTKKTGKRQEILDWHNPEKLDKSSFDPTKPTVIITHGFRSGIDKEWIAELADVLLWRDNVNAFRVGWGGGANINDYDQAAANTRVVGAAIAFMIRKMKDRGADLDKFWLIGHSLGAHLMSFVGRRVKGIGRITGLDPAEPHFEGKGTDARLDPTDAKFVDVIHTDAGGIGIGALFSDEERGVGFGASEPMGHVDYYPNGGKAQPGCPTVSHMKSPHKWLTGKISGKSVTCNHARAHQLLIAAIRNEGRTSCRFEAHRCPSYDSFLDGECLKDCRRGQGQGCTLVGADARATRPKTTETGIKMYFLTSDKKPYCVDKYTMVNVVLGSGFDTVPGKIYVKIGHLPKQEVTRGTETTLKPGLRLRQLVAMNEKWDRLEVRFKSLKWNTNFVNHEIVVGSFSLEPLEGGKPLDFCSNNKRKQFTLKRDPKWMTLKRC